MTADLVTLVAEPWDDWGSYSGPPEAALVYPPPVGTVITIDGPPNVWKMRVFAERLDAALPGVEVVSAPASALPDALHVTVVKTDTLDFGWVGSTEWSYAAEKADAAYPTDVRISLSTKIADASARVKRYVAAHEFMHVLGFRHHGGSGLVGIDPSSYYATSPLPGPGEWAALHACFGGPPEPAPTLPLPRPACQDAVVCR